MQVIDKIEVTPESGWRWTTLDQICCVNPKSPAVAYPHSEVTFVPMQAVDAELGEITAPQIRPIGEVQKGYTRFQDGDVIFAKITPCMENGKAAIARELIGGIGFGSTEFHVLRPREGTLAEWIYFFIRQEWFRDYARDNFTGTAGQRRVPTEFLKNVEIPLPPLDEQRRIVGVLREALAEQRRGREALGQVAGQMKRFRQAVLAQAFRGELTAEWREAHADRFREAAEAYDALLAERGAAAPRSEDLPAPIRDWLPADRLREVILADRRARWESAQLAKMAAKGGPKDDKWKSKYVEPAFSEAESAEALLAAESGWDVVTLESLATAVGDVDHRMPKQVPAGVPYVSTRDFFGFNEIAFESAKLISLEDYAALARKIRPEADDLLLSRYGTVGEVRLVRRDEPFQASYSIAIIKPLREVPISNWLFWVLRSPWLQQQIKRDVRASAQPDLGLAHIRLFEVPLPPLAEQREIVARVEALFAQAEATESTAATALANLRRLEQSTLRAAFAGEL